MNNKIFWKLLIINIFFIFVNIVFTLFFNHMYNLLYHYDLQQIAYYSDNGKYVIDYAMISSSLIIFKYLLYGFSLFIAFITYLYIHNESVEIRKNEYSYW